ncbi:MAG: YigZ family protein [Balneolales bacterium]
MKTIIQPVTDTYSEQGSKFIGFLSPTGGQKDIDKQLAALKEQYPDATHHCYAYRINPENLQEYAQDDGEPSGSAGLPILNALKSAELTNVLLVVVRYFGGTKLGKSGLISAYRATAEMCTEKAVAGELFAVRRFRLVYPYPEQKRIDQLIHIYNLTVFDETYTDVVEITVDCENSHAPDLKNKLEAQAHLGIKIEYLGKFYGVN